MVTGKNITTLVHLAQAVTDGTGRKVTVIYTCHRLSQMEQVEK